MNFAVYYKAKHGNMLTKEKLKKQIEKFPEEFSIEDLIERLILVEKIEKGVKQSESQEVLSEQEMSKEIEKWFN